MCSLIILFSILINQKPDISVKEKQTAQPGKVQESYTHQNIQIHTPKIYIVLYYNKGTIDYSQQCHPLHLGNEQYKQFPQKKISRKRKREGKRGRESAKGKEKEMEKRKKRRRKERKRECEREGEGERRGGRRGENRESGTKKSSSLSTLPSPDAFPSTVPSPDGARE